MTLYDFLVAQGYKFTDITVNRKNEVLIMQNKIPFDSEKLLGLIGEYLSDHFELVQAGNDTVESEDSLIFDRTLSIKAKDEMFFVGFVIVSIKNRNGQSHCTVKLVYHYGREIISREMLTPQGV